MHAGRTPITLCVLALLLSGCGGGGDGELPDPTVAHPAEGSFAVPFSVVDSAGLPVGGAQVYLVPVTAVNQTPFNGFNVRTGTSENRDEPLEDPVRLGGAGFPQAVTNAAGQATVTSVPDARYFVFVAPAPGDTEHLPGGNRSRQAMDALTLSLATTEVVLSSQPGAAATYLGSNTCTTCHSAYLSTKTHAHKLALAVPGQLSPGQDAARYPQFQDGWNRFLPANSYLGGTVVWCYDYDGSRSSDKFLTSLTNPTLRDPLAVTYLKAWLWRDNADSKYKVTLENVHPLAGAPGMGDPPNPFTLVVDLTYGGAIYRQRLLVAVPGRKGRYPLLQYQTEGVDGRFDRTRRVYRDFNLGLFWDDAGKKLQNPPTTATFEGNCMACHATGFERFQDGMTGEWLARAVADPLGAFDIDGNGSKDEINIGCEVCHGPGSDHATWAGNPANTGMRARYIVTPQNLSPSREMMICGRCHDGVQGNGSQVNDEPLDSSDRMARPGIGRADYLASYVSRKGPGPANLWSDELHSRSEHQQYADLIKSRKHRNDRLLVVCSNCHDLHGNGMFRQHLRWDPDDSATGLCFRCHGQVLIPHMLDKTPDTHAGNATECWNCHMAKTAQGGAGRFGLLIGIPTGGPGDPAVTYWENDLASHLFSAIPRKTHPNVVGDPPGEAMPIPYTRSCGLGCHNAAPLPIPKFIPLSGGEER